MLSSLSDCIKNRDSDKWFDTCQLICNNFSIVKHVQFFFPDIDSFRKVTSYLKDAKTKLESASEEQAVPA